MSLPPRIARPPRGQNLEPRKREGMSPTHLAWVRTLPCCCCPHPHGPGGEAHHLLRIQGQSGTAPGHRRGMGLKSPDRWAVPLCRAHHHALHQHGGEESWFAGQGVDARSLAGRLWLVSGDTLQGERAVYRARS